MTSFATISSSNSTEPLIDCVSVDNPDANVTPLEGGLIVDTSVSLINVRSRLAFDAAWDGSKVHQWPYHGHDNQRWVFKETEEDSVYIIASEMDSTGNTVLDVANEKTANGAGLRVYKRHEGDNQKWRVTHVSPNVFSIVSVSAGRCLDVSGGSLHRGGKIHLWDSYFHDNQLWEIVPTNACQFPYLEPADLHKYSVPFSRFSDCKITLEEHGFVIISDIFDCEEIHQAAISIGEDLREVCDDDACLSETVHPTIADAYAEFTSVPAESCVERWPGCSFQSNFRGLGQGRYPWYFRSHEKIREIYSFLYDLSPEELVVGMDAVFFKPFASPATRWTTEWGHCDHNIKRADTGPDWLVYQSVASVWPSVTEQDATTVMWPGSHKEIFPGMMSDPDVTPSNGHYIPLGSLLKSNSPERHRLLERYQREARRIPLPAGSLLIWDSRTVHQGWSEGRRLAMPICWEPRSRRSETALRRKLRLCASGLVTTHWASLGEQHHIDAHREVFEGEAVDEGQDIMHVKLPLTTGIIPYGLREGVSWEEVKEACAAAKAKGDQSEKAAERIRSFLKPEIAALL